MKIIYLIFALAASGYILQTMCCYDNPITKERNCRPCKQA